MHRTPLGRERGGHDGNSKNGEAQAVTWWLHDFPLHLRCLVNHGQYPCLL